MAIINAIRLVIGIVLLLAATSCQEHPHFFLLNHSGHNVLIEFQDNSKISLQAGKWTELEFNTGMRIIVDDKTYIYAWHYPKPVSEFYEYGNPAGRFSLSIEPDDAIYARKTDPSKPANDIPIQPDGYPLLPH